VCQLVHDSVGITAIITIQSTVPQSVAVTWHKQGDILTAYDML